MSDLELVLALLLAAAVLVRPAELVSVPHPIALVLGGLALAAVPGLPRIELEPDVVFLLFLPRCCIQRVVLPQSLLLFHASRGRRERYRFARDGAARGLHPQLGPTVTSSAVFLDEGATVTAAFVS